MVICDVANNHEVHRVEELEDVFAKRHGDNSSSFWLAEHPGTYPQLAIVVKNNHAALYYFPGGNMAGFRSIGEGIGLEPNGMTTFMTSSFGDNISVLNNSIVPVSVALEAAKEFLASKQLPKSVAWEEL